jgi:biotin carboxylase
MKTIALLGAGSEQVDVIKLAKNLGYNVISLDSNLSAPGAKISDRFFRCDISSVNAVNKILKNLEIDGVMVHGVELSTVVSEVSSMLGLKSISTEAAKNSTHKLKRLEILKKNKIPCAIFGSASDLIEAKKIAKDIGYPVVIKPVDNAGSRGVILIKSELDLEKYFYESLSNCKFEKLVLIEEHMEGHQISSETVVYNKKMFTTGFSDRNYENMDVYHPYFIEDGSDMPSNLNQKIKTKTIELIEKTIRILGIDFGAAKGDLLIKNGVPYVIEMASRTSGGRFATHQVPNSTGVNILKPLLQMSCNDDVDQNDFIPKFCLGSSQRYIIPKPGKIISVNGINNIHQFPGVSSVFIDKNIQIGTKIPPIISHIPRIGVVMATGKTRNEAKFNAIKARDSIQIITDE